jgi:hypothetical protein
MIGKRKNSNNVPKIEQEKLLENRCYKTINGDVVYIYAIHEWSPWGIFGKFLTGERKGDQEQWDDSMYPYRTSFDEDEYGFSLTTELISKEKFPEYFL